MAASEHSFQAPKGTRDFYPADLALRQHVESAWREVSSAWGFDEVDGPTYEHLDLYTVKSGEGIVSELFSFRRTGGETEYALRPEFTPTLARMAGRIASATGMPIKWFSIGSMFRAERPQRGRLREHVQWNVDYIGDADTRAEIEVIDVLVAFLARMGLTTADVRIHLSHRVTVGSLLQALGLPADSEGEAFDLLDRRHRMEPNAFMEKAGALGIPPESLERFLTLSAEALPGPQFRDAISAAGYDEDQFSALLELQARFDEAGLEDWILYDLGIVRGLAYYTGTVFEVQETGGKERAIAGGGRYDQLLSMFGGPDLPAVGFGMGDVVLQLVLEERGLLGTGEEYLPQPDVFVIPTDAVGQDRVREITSSLRSRGYHVRYSYRETRNLGKLLGEASRSRARQALILESEESFQCKDLASGDQVAVNAEAVADHLGPPSCPT